MRSMVSLRYLGSLLVIVSPLLLGSMLGCDSSSGSGKGSSDASTSPDGATAVVANGGNPGGVTTVNLSTFATDTVSFAGQASSQPGSVAITPDGTTALVAQLNNVVLVNLSSKMVTGTFTPLSTSATAFGVAVTPDGASALITRGVTTNSIRRIDLATGNVTIIDDTSSSYGVAVTADGMSALVSSGPGDTIKLISLASNEVTGSIDYASNSDVGNLAISPDGQTAVVAGDFDLGILSIAAKSVLARLPAALRSVAITPDGERALFTGAGSTGKLHVVKLP